MNLHEVIVAGTLNSDGTLALDEKPPISPGRVVVVLRPAVSSEEKPSESLTDFARRIHRESQSRGHHFMTQEEIAAWIDELREDDDRVEAAYRQPLDRP